MQSFASRWIWKPALTILLAVTLAAPPRPAAAQDQEHKSPIRWQVNTFTTGNSDLPANYVTALLPAGDGALWVGLFGGGLARLVAGQVAEVVTTAQGLPDNRVSGLALGTGDTFWIGTHGGLARLVDGRTAEVVTTAQGLPRNRIFALAPGADGDLWIGTGGGLARLADGRVAEVVTTAQGLPDNQIWALAPGSHGDLWIGTGGGLARLVDGRIGEVVTTVQGLPDNQIWALAPGSHGELWVGTGGGLARLEDGRVAEVVTTAQGLPANQIWALAPGSHGELWVGTAGGLTRLVDGRIAEVVTTAQGLPRNRIFALAPGSHGDLWIGTGGGLARLAEGQVSEVLTTAQGLPDSSVWALAAGADGEIWIGTDGGLARLAEGQVSEVLTTAQGLPDSSVWALAAGADGEIWIGAVGGLARLEGGQAAEMLTAAQALPDDRVRVLLPTGEGALWVGTGGGLARLAGGQVGEVLTTAQGLPDNRIFALAPGSHGELWVGTGGGLARLEDGRVAEVVTTAQGLPDNQIWALAPGSHGELWVGTAGGLARLEGGQVAEVLTAAQALPDDRVGALLPARDGALWVGTGGGLARVAGRLVDLVITTEEGLPANGVTALAPAGDGALWVGTDSGLARLKPPEVPPLIVKLIGQLGSEEAKITQTQHTFAAVPFDPKYQTDGREWRFLWRLERPSGEASETHTRSSYYVADNLKEDGEYKLTVEAIDEYGLRSEPHVYEFDVALPKDDPVEVWAEQLGFWAVLASGVYFLALFPLIWLCPRASWARSAVNSGVFTKFPILHKTVLNSDWARRRIFRRHAEMAVGAARVPEHYIPQAVFRAAGTTAAPLTIGGLSDALAALFEPSRRVLVLARSGTGKSVLLRFLLREMAGRFLRGEDRRLPVLIDLRTSPIAGRDVEALIRDALKGGGTQPLEGGGVELPDDILDHLIRKGRFVLLIDSLNELADWKDAGAFHPFFNRDAANHAIVASQVDLLERTDFATYRLAEVTPEQAGAYLQEATGTDVWEQLPAEARALARNPQDLALLAEVIGNLGPDEPVPSRRAELYRAILEQDALAEWAAAGGPAIRAVYGLAMRMVEERLVVGEEQLREWLREELKSRDAFSDEVMAEVVGAIGRSRLFREETEVDVLGRRRPVTGFRHELVGKFLASRHVREVLATPGDERREPYLALSGEEPWLDLFYFIVDELESKLALNVFLKELLDRGGDARLRIVAYALKTKPDGTITGEVRQAYNLAKLDEDILRTPAA